MASGGSSGARLARSEPRNRPSSYTRLDSEELSSLGSAKFEDRPNNWVRQFRFLTLNCLKISDLYMHTELYYSIIKKNVNCLVSVAVTLYCKKKKTGIKSVLKTTLPFTLCTQSLANRSEYNQILKMISDITSIT